ncbi:MAG: hypothetical protein SGJ09_17140 [Phycisphaerae bacterium]|nr:hypothetical protein [Phycisphaerae bacterium]
MLRINSRLISSLLAAPLVLAGSLLVGTGVAGPSTSENPGTLVRALRNAESLSVEATVEFSTIDARSYPAVASDGYPIIGHFAYSAAGKAWSATSWLDPTRFKGMDTILTYDGVQQFTAQSGSDIMSVSEAGEPGVLGMTLPNPLIALASYARPVSDANIAEQMKLSDMRKLTEEALDVPAAAWMPVTVDGVAHERATVPGSTVFGVSYVHVVTVLASKRSEPVRIERVTPNGEVLTRFSFTSWQTTDGGSASLGALRLPRHIDIEEFRPSDGASLYRVTYLVSAVHVDTPLATGPVMADVSGATHVYQTDLGRFVR